MMAPRGASRECITLVRQAGSCSWPCNRTCPPASSYEVRVIDATTGDDLSVGIWPGDKEYYYLAQPAFDGENFVAFGCAGSDSQCELAAQAASGSEPTWTVAPSFGDEIESLFVAIAADGDTIAAATKPEESSHWTGLSKHSALGGSLVWESSIGATIKQLLALPDAGFAIAGPAELYRSGDILEIVPVVERYGAAGESEWIAELPAALTINGMATTPAGQLVVAGSYDGPVPALGLEGDGEGFVAMLDAEGSIIDSHSTPEALLQVAATDELIFVAGERRITAIDL